jgi:hypothetical protein
LEATILDMHLDLFFDNPTFGSCIVHAPRTRTRHFGRPTSRPSIHDDPNQKIKCLGHIPTRFAGRQIPPQNAMRFGVRVQGLWLHPITRFAVGMRAHKQQRDFGNGIQDGNHLINGPQTRSIHAGKDKNRGRSTIQSIEECFWGAVQLRDIVQDKARGAGMRMGEFDGL